MNDPKAELRDQIRDKLLARFLERARDGVADSPEGHCADLADQVMGLFTVTEDYQSIEDHRLAKAEPDLMWRRRLIAKTDWQATPEPERARQARRRAEQEMDVLRANGIDPSTVLAQPGPDIDVIARTITVHHLPPRGTGATSWQQSYPMNVLPEGW